MKTEFKLFVVACTAFIASACCKPNVKFDGKDDKDDKKPSVVSEFIENTSGLNMKMIYVEGGDFLMGATEEQGSDAGYDEKPVRLVTLDSYYIGECEITQEQWTDIMGTTVSYYGPSNVGWGNDYPMYNVTWENAKDFCRELSRLTGRKYCLPTEAQWEYAARGGKKADGCKYSGSGSVDAVAWYDGNSGSVVWHVKTRQPNGLGLYDMSGNVAEWCEDWYASSYDANDTNNPKGPSSGNGRVLRGGNASPSCKARSCRVSSRDYLFPDGRTNFIGFRVVLIP